MMQHVFSDVDGTILDEDGRYEPSLVDAIKESSAKIGLATNRSLSFVTPLYRELGMDGLMVLEDGAMIYDPSNGRSTFLVDRSEIDAFRTEIFKETPDGSTFTFDGELMRINYSSGKICCISAHIRTVEGKKDETRMIGLTELMNETLAERGYTLEAYNTGRGNIFIKPVGTSKGNAMNYLEKSGVIGDDSTLVIGDGVNDLSMFIEATGAAVNNACDDLKRVAAYVSPYDTSLGVIDIFGRFT